MARAHRCPQANDLAPSVILPDALAARVTALAREGAPGEVCGLLSGRPAAPGGADADRVTGVHPVVNVADDPVTRFHLDPVGLLRVTRIVEAGGAEVLAVFHSHPRGRAVPSPTDRERSALVPARWWHLLVGLGRGAEAELRAWEVRPGSTRELRLSVPGRPPRP